MDHESGGMTSELEAGDLSAHVAACAQRYMALEKRLETIESKQNTIIRFLIAANASFVGLLLTVILSLVYFISQHIEIVP